MRKVHCSVISVIVICCLGWSLCVIAAQNESPQTGVDSPENIKKAQNQLRQIGVYDLSKAIPVVLGINVTAAYWDILASKDYDYGITFCNKAIEALPPAYNGLKNSITSFRGLGWQFKGQYDKAIADFQASAMAGNIQAMSWLADLLATCPETEYRDGNTALEYAQKVIAQAEEENAEDFHILAAAYAEAGNFQEAVQAQEKALGLLIDAQEKALAKKEGESEKEELKKKQEEVRIQYEERLESYKAGKPWGMQPPKTD